MKNKIEALEKFLQAGAIFDPEAAPPWILTNQEDEEICRGQSLFEMIENCPAENSKSFGEVENTCIFTYLEEDYLKLNSKQGMRLSDQYEWRFKGDEEVFVK